MIEFYCYYIAILTTSAQLGQKKNGHVVQEQFWLWNYFEYVF